MRRVILSAVALAIAALSAADAQASFTDGQANYGQGGDFEALGLGSYGWLIPNLQSSLPAGTTVTSVGTVDHNFWTINGDINRWVEVPGTTNRVNNIWYSFNPFTVTVATNQPCIDVHFYQLDGDANVRRQTIEPQNRGAGHGIPITQAFDVGVYSTFRQEIGSETYQFTLDSTPGSTNIVVSAVAIDLCSSPTTTTTPAPTPPPTPACNCATTTNLEVDYSSNDIPDATANAVVDIFLDKSVWQVKFVVSNVKSINNGHVIPHSVDTQQLSAVDAFSPNTQAFVQADLWNPPACSLGPVDTASTDAASGAEGVVVGFNPASCEKNYTMSYSLISPSAQDMKHCELNVNGAVITVNCSVTLSTVRAYDLTEPLGYTAQETAFAASIDLRNDLTFTEANLLHATLAKCSVKNGPLYVVDCRVPGEWVFDQSAFSLVQEPAGWIDAASCASNVVGTGDTASSYIRCNIVNNAPIADVQTARANLTAHRVGAAAGDDLTFDVEYIIPRKVTTSASASLASFVTSIAMADGLYYYGTADKAVLEIGVVDSARLSMTALDLFNDASPRVVYDIFPGTSDARFQTSLNAVTDRFTIEFYPAAIREDSEFYRYGPHGINVSFTFSAARRVVGGGTGGAGNVLVEGLNVEGTEATTSSSAQGSAASSSSGTALMAGVAVGAAVLVAGLVGAAVVAVKRRGAAAEQKEQL